MKYIEKAIKSCFDLEHIKEIEEGEVISLTKGELYELIDIALKEQAKEIFDYVLLSGIIDCDDYDERYKRLKQFKQKQLGNKE